MSPLPSRGSHARALHSPSCSLPRTQTRPLWHSGTPAGSGVRGQVSWVGLSGGLPALSTDSPLFLQKLFGFLLEYTETWLQAIPRPRRH